MNLIYSKGHDFSAVEEEEGGGGYGNPPNTPITESGGSLNSSYSSSSSLRSATPFSTVFMHNEKTSTPAGVQVSRRVANGSNELRYRGGTQTEINNNNSEYYTPGYYDKTKAKTSFVDSGFKSNNSSTLFDDISTPIRDLRSKFRREQLRLFSSYSEIDDVSAKLIRRHEHLLPYLLVVVILASSFFSLYAISYAYRSQSFNVSQLDGKRESIRFGHEKRRENLVKDGRLLPDDIRDEDGNLLGGKKAAIQYAYDLRNRKIGETVVEQEKNESAQPQEVEPKPEDKVKVEKEELKVKVDPEEDASETIKRVLQELDNGVIASRKKLRAYLKSMDEEKRSKDREEQPEDLPEPADQPKPKSRKKTLTKKASVEEMNVVKKAKKVKVSVEDHPETKIQEEKARPAAAAVTQDEDVGNENGDVEESDEDEGPSDEDDPFRMFPSNDEEDNVED